MKKYPGIVLYGFLSWLISLYKNKLSYNFRGILFCLLFTSGFIGQGQEFYTILDLYERGESFQKYRCLDRDLDFGTLSLRMIAAPDAPIQNSYIWVMLNGREITFFEDYRYLDGYKLRMLLEQNRAYDSESYLEFRCTFRLQDGREIYQILSYCVNRIRAGAANGPVPGEQPPEPPPPPAGDEQVFHMEIKPSFVRVPVFFATDRKDTQSSDPNARFGRDLAAPFHINYGICEVSIPFTHEVGEIENPSIWRLEFTENPNRHIVLQKIKLLDSENYFKVLSASIKQTTKKRTFLFVHGYNVSFADAAKRTAQIKYDLNFSGAAIFYSWPSQASTTAYTVDETNIEWAETNMKHFLADYLSKSEAEEIYLIAHSMGNRGLTNALISLVSEQPELNKKIKEIILAAPDIDVGIFKRDIAPQMVSKIKKPITLYVSSDDVALKASREVHGRPRAGDSAKGITLVQGIETIDASNIDTSFLGHSYFAETKTILSDIYNLINTGKRASQRTQLELVRLGNGSYWKVKK